MIKRMVAVFLVFVVSLSLIAGCKSPSRKPVPPTPAGKTAKKPTQQRISAIQSPPATTPVPPKTTQYVGTEFERRVVQLCNIERQKVGHEPLLEEKLLDSGATDKAVDMRDKKYFGHTSPTFGSPFKMMKSYGVPYQRAGENIASGYTTPEAVVKGWMNSPGHRANILSTKFGSIGVGYAKGGKSGAYWVQWFTN